MIINKIIIYKMIIYKMIIYKVQLIILILQNIYKHKMYNNLKIINKISNN